MTVKTRVLASLMVVRVEEGHSLNETFAEYFPQLTDHRDRAFVQALVYGVCRWYFRLDVILSELLSKPMKAKDSDVHALLLIGLYQLLNMRVPPHAAVSETVEAVEAFKKPWGKALVNAILRGFLRKQTELEKIVNADEEAKYAHPQWFIRSLQRSWPKHWEQILQANNEHPPLVLRVNAQKSTREAYLLKLVAAGIPAQALKTTTHGIELDEAYPVEMLPGFAEGLVSVQDGSAQLAPSLLQLTPKLRVLDACAAPGGKLCHLAEGPFSLDLVAIEKDAMRKKNIDENLARLELHALCLVADAGDLKAWWDGKPFDRILLDAPCSGTGVIRRHPDIKLLRTEQDIRKGALEQLRLLNTLWTVLKPGGLLLYVTCSVLREENDRIIETFLANQTDSSVEPIQGPETEATPYGIQIIPGNQNRDGFYYSLLRKR